MAVFERAEYLDRVARVKTRMARDGLDLLVVTDPANMNYLAGYDGWSFYVHQCLIVTQDHAEPLWIGRAQDASGARITTWLSADAVIGYPDRYVQSTECHPMDFVADLLTDRGWDKGRIGTEQDAYYFNAACQAALEAGLPNARFADATLLANWERAVKSDAEVAHLRIAGKIMERVMDAALDATAPGAGSRWCLARSWGPEWVAVSWWTAASGAVAMRSAANGATIRSPGRAPKSVPAPTATAASAAASKRFCPAPGWRPTTSERPAGAGSRRGS